MPLSEARAKRDDVAELVRSGQDPRHARKVEVITKKLEQETTFEALAREWHSGCRYGDDEGMERVNRLLIDLGVLLPAHDGKAAMQKKLPGMGNARVYCISPKLWELDDD